MKDEAFDTVGTSDCTGLAAGVAPRVLADRLGHSTTAVTTDTYQHVLPDLDHDAARRVAALVFPDPALRTTKEGTA